jgi:hypothetical protein
MHDRYVARRNATSVEEVSLGYRTVRLLRPDELEEAQVGYGGEGWAASWLVIATEDQLGDPIFTDLAEERLPVFTAAHGEGVWEPVQIADSLEGFALGLDAIASVSEGREHPVGLETNPVPAADMDRVLVHVRDANPASDDEFWASWFDID